MNIEDPRAPAIELEREDSAAPGIALPPAFEEWTDPSPFAPERPETPPPRRRRGRVALAMALSALLHAGGLALFLFAPAPVNDEPEVLEIPVEMVEAANEPPPPVVPMTEPPPEPEPPLPEPAPEPDSPTVEAAREAPPPEPVPEPPVAVVEPAPDSAPPPEPAVEFIPSPVVRPPGSEPKPDRPKRVEPEPRPRRPSAERKPEPRPAPARPAVERPPPAQPAAPSPAAIGAWKSAIAGRIAANRTYPESARARGAAGTTIVSLSIGPGGALAGASVTQSSGQPDLDAAAMSAVRRAAPFPPPPPGAPRGFSVPFRFGLR